MAKYGDGPSGMKLPLVWNVAVTDLPFGAFPLAVADTLLGEDQIIKLGRLPSQFTPRILF